MPNGGWSPTGAFGGGFTTGATASTPSAPTPSAPTVTTATFASSVSSPSYTISGGGGGGGGVAPPAPTPEPKPAPEVQEAIQTTPTAPTTAEIIAAGGVADPRIYSVTTETGEQVFNPANPEVQAAMAAGVPPPPSPEVVPLGEAPLPPEVTYDVQDPLQVALAEQRAREEFAIGQAQALREGAAQIAAAGLEANEATVQQMLARAAAIEQQLPAEAVSAAAQLQQLQFQTTMMPSISPPPTPPGQIPVDQAAALAYSVQDTVNAGRGALLVQAEQTPEGEWVVGYRPEVGISPQMQEQLRTAVSEFQQRLYPNTEIVELPDGRFMIVAAAAAATTLSAGLETFGEGAIQPTLGVSQKLYGGYTVSQLEELFGRDIPESAIGQVLATDIPTEEVKVGTYTVAITPTSLLETQDIDETTGVDAEDFSRLTPAPAVAGGAEIIDVAATRTALEAQGFKLKGIEDSKVILEKDILAETGGKEISLELLPIGQRDFTGLERRPLEDLTPEERERLARETTLDVAYQQERFRLGAAAGGVAPGAVGAAFTTLTPEEQREAGLILKTEQYGVGLPGVVLASPEAIQRFTEREATLESLVQQTGIPGVVSDIEGAFKGYKIQEETATEPIAQISGRVMTTAGDIISQTAESIGGIATQTGPLVFGVYEEKAQQIQEGLKAFVQFPLQPEETRATLEKIQAEETARLERGYELGQVIGRRGIEWAGAIPTRPGEAARELFVTGGSLLLTGAILGGAMYGVGKAAQAIRTKAIAFQQARAARDISQVAYTGGIYAGAEFPQPFQYVQVSATAGGQVLAPPTRFLAPTPTLAGPGIVAEAGRAVSTGQLITPRGTYQVFVPGAQYTIGTGAPLTYPVATPLATVGAPITPATFGTTYAYTTPTFGVPPSPLTTVPYTQIRGAQITPDISLATPTGITGRVYAPSALGYQPITPTAITPTYSYAVAPFRYTDVGLITGKAIITTPGGEVISRDILGSTLARETGRGKGIYRVTGQYFTQAQPPTPFTQYITTEPLTLQQELGRAVIAEQPTYAIRDYGLTLAEGAGRRGVVSGVYFQEIPTGVAPTMVQAGGTLTYISPGAKYGTVTFGGAVGAPGVSPIPIVAIEPALPVVSPGAVTTFVSVPAERGMQLGMLQQQQLVTPPPTTQAVIRGAFEAEIRQAVTELTLQEIAAGYAIPTAESLAATGIATGITTAGIQALEVPVTVSAVEGRPPPIALREAEAIRPIEREVLAMRMPSAVARPTISAREFVVTRERPLVSPIEAERISPALQQRPIAFQRMAEVGEVAVARPTAQVARPLTITEVVSRTAITPVAEEAIISRGLTGAIEREAILQRPIQQQIYKRPITTITTTTTPRVPPPPPVVPWFVPPPVVPILGKPDIKPSRIEEALAFKRRKPRPAERRPRGLLSDLLSLQRSQIFYGRATTPSIVKRPELFEYEERYPIGKVPTVEELEYGIIRKRLVDGKLRKTLKRFGKKLTRRKIL